MGNLIETGDKVMLVSILRILPPRAPTCELLKLRYTLVWARMRSSKLRIILFAVSSLVFVYFLFVSGVAGFGTALFAARSVLNAGSISAILGVVYFGSITATALLGLGPQAAVSDRTLRRFPLFPAQRVVARHLTGWLSPLWLTASVLTAGLVGGLATVGQVHVFRSLVVLFLFIPAAYLSGALILEIIDRTLYSLRGIVSLCLIAISFLGMTHFMVFRRLFSLRGSPYLQFLPPVAAFRLLTIPSSLAALHYTLILCAWCAILLVCLLQLEKLPPKSAPAYSGIAGRSRAYDWIARRFGREGAAIAGKSLRYHLRCHRVRFGLIVTTPVLYIYCDWMGQKMGPDGAPFGMLAAFFLLSLCGTRAMMLNHFGFDGSGLRRYALCPTSYPAVLRYESLVSLLLGLSLILPVFLVFWISGAAGADLRLMILLFCSATAGGLFFSALGLVTSVLAPRRVAFDKVIGNDMSLAGNVTLFLGFMASFGVAFSLAADCRFSSVLHYWWLSFGLMGPAVAFYLLCSAALVRPLERRRERLLAEMSKE